MLIGMLFNLIFTKHYSMNNSLRNLFTSHKAHTMIDWPSHLQTPGAALSRRVIDGHLQSTSGVFV